ncbi:hypothetical protein A3D78_05175 [Candidatus Gottesmanbacteria bacterium RIFCSPHIGHO2_02_FULL_39_14]|uniref:Probable 2-phosphosulfolactate phosphatase n=2 Tax=Candidatus Gottesmaniibacteriota TaxID=1752720 RepID=A0A1F5ZYR4_9BACT|nr:MAG: hypothetical protein A3D78_05175 [Candidatus Gottesmanbacteria bacterium RIFCSPHIGHO2_02_FULL_39_14]OGG32450.1 MAG: hypothetical protein A3I51_05150 [Candidatus Gottesmanbacteria bacterium RIFCSPLOWO2_02_FULL_38_8]
MTPKSFYQRKITISFPWDLPDKINGPAVMFDVNAASHNIAYLVKIALELLVVDKKNVHQALKAIPEAVLAGESDDPLLQKRFFVSNSASLVNKADLHKKKVILITNNGTHTINELWEKGADPILVAGYANLQTVANWLLRNYLDTPMITLVPSGGREERYAQNRNLLEDLLCAQALEKLLREKKPDLKADFSKARKFIKDHNPQYWPTKEADLALIFTEKDLYQVVPICIKHKNGFLQIKNWR